jgi:hypothetical protein
MRLSEKKKIPHCSQNKELLLLNLFVMFKFLNGINRIKAEYNEITIGKDYNHMDMLKVVTNEKGEAVGEVLTIIY